MHAFLTGGGREAASVLAAHRPFIGALAGSGPVACIVLDEGESTDPDRWSASLRAAGAGEVRVVVVSPGRPPVAADMDGASGVYVAGGLTPGYQAVLAADVSWLGSSAIPYAGFSAGAAVAARRSVVGGWRAVVGGVEVAVCDDGAGEDLHLVTVRDGLGVVDVLVDVHAAQWGTLGRLCHAVVAEGVEGWAIDEGTTLECRDGRPVAVHGVGAAARVVPPGPAAGGEVAVRFFAAGSV